MRYEDEIYGPVTITESVLRELIQSAAVQRLQGVLQHGISGLIGITSPLTRFDHSLGTMLLVRRLGGPLREQIAALLHDISHTAFSHVIDYVFDSRVSQSYHDEKKADYVAHTDIPAILARHGYDWREAVHEEYFPLLEQPAPRLCADRLDYFLRDSKDLGLATAVDIQCVLDHIVVMHGRIATNSLEAARWMGYTYIQADDTSWANFREVGVYELMAQAIKVGLQTGAIALTDIWQTDRLVWNKLHASPHPDVQATMALISPETQFVWDEAHPTFRVKTKLRTIDPDVVVNGTLQPLSTLDTAFACHRTAYLTRKQGVWPMRVIASPGTGRPPLPADTVESPDGIIRPSAGAGRASEA
jgi:HD superfamily phosphohydrolase